MFREAATHNHTTDLEEYTASLTGSISKSIDFVTFLCDHHLMCKPFIRMVFPSPLWVTTIGHSPFQAVWGPSHISMTHWQDLPQHAAYATADLDDIVIYGNDWQQNLQSESCPEILEMGRTLTKPKEVCNWAGGGTVSGRQWLQPGRDSGSIRRLGSSWDCLEVTVGLCLIIQISAVGWPTSRNRVPDLTFPWLSRQAERLPGLSGDWECGSGAWLEPVCEWRESQGLESG